VNASQKRDFLKLVEELSELSVELVQQINKPTKARNKRISDEIEDVEKRLKPVKKFLTTVL
tara:strand:- start:4255 stop:4437 length:183 start_codon:yes stop_codon:yes gene_type:complete